MTGIREGLATALHLVILAGIPSVAAFVVTLLISELPLRKVPYTNERS